MKKGDKVKTRSGKHGTIHSVHTGTYYGVVHTGGFGYFPAQHVEPDDVGATPSNPDPDRDGDNDLGGTGQPMP